MRLYLRKKNLQKNKILETKIVLKTNITFTFKTWNIGNKTHYSYVGITFDMLQK